MCGGNYVLKNYTVPDNSSTAGSLEKALCFTGHRPEKLPGKADIRHSGFRRLLALLKAEIECAVRDEGYRTFYTGMSRGIDLYAGDMVVNLKNRYPDVKVICAMPYPDFGKGFKGLDGEIYQKILENADGVAEVSDHYHKKCMFMRNQYMVDHSSKLIAVVGDMKSGTGHTIRCAQRCGLEIVRIDLNNPALLNDGTAANKGKLSEEKASLSEYEQLMFKDTP